MRFLGLGPVGKRWFDVRKSALGRCVGALGNTRFIRLLRLLHGLFDRCQARRVGGICLLAALPKTFRVTRVSDVALDHGLAVGKVAFGAADPHAPPSRSALLSALVHTGVLLSITLIQDHVDSETIERLGHSAKFAT
jgi:hypothetical protein